MKLSAQIDVDHDQKHNKRKIIKMTSDLENSEDIINKIGRNLSTSNLENSDDVRKRKKHKNSVDKIKFSKLNKSIELNNFNNISADKTPISDKDTNDIPLKKKRKTCNSTNVIKTESECTRNDFDDQSCTSVDIHYNKSILSITKKKDRKRKSNQDFNELKLISNDTLNPSDHLQINLQKPQELPTITDSNDLQSGNISKLNSNKKNRNKRKLDQLICTDNTYERDSTSNNDCIDNTNSPKNSNIFITNEAIQANYSENSPLQTVTKKKKKKNKFSQINTSVDAQTASQNLNEGDAALTSNSHATPLKSCLKKKKRKYKKKKNEMELHNRNIDVNKSVTFDKNVKVEVIENCLSKSSAQKPQLDNSHKKTKALAYLKRWKEDRQNWKFEKLTQLWLLKNMFQEQMVPSENFDNMLEYIIDIKGANRTLIIDLSEKIVSKMEHTIPEQVDKELETAYKRARSVLQYLQ